MKSTFISALYFSVLWEEDKKDIFDLMTPFVKYSIAINNDPGDQISINTIKISMSTQFDFNHLPTAVVEKLLKRLLKNEGLVYKDEKAYFLSSELKTKEKTKPYLKKFAIDFESALQENKTLTDTVIFALAKHLNLDPYKHRDRVETMLLDFFDIKGDSALIDVDNIQSDIHTQQLFKVGTFILKEYNNEDKYLFKLIIKLLEGYMLKQIIYFEDNYVDKNAKIKNLTVYLDTVILLRLLGLKTAEENDSANAMINMLKDLGADIKCFSHNIDEVNGILNKYMLSRNKLRYQTLEFFDENNYPNESIEAFIDTIEVKIESRGVKICDPPDFKGSNIDYDESKLAEHIKQIGYSNDNNEALDNDIKSITAIRRYRSESKQKTKLHRLETSVALFVTNNANLVRETKNYFSETDQYEKKPFIPIIMTDKELIVLLWFKSSKKSHKFSQLTLLQNARAATNPSPRLLEKIKDKIKSFEKLEVDNAQYLENVLATNFTNREILGKMMQEDITIDVLLQRELDDLLSIKSDNNKLSSIIKDLSNDIEISKEDLNNQKKITSATKEELMRDLRRKSLKFTKLMTIITFFIGIGLLIILIYLFTNIIKTNSIIFEIASIVPAILVSIMLFIFDLIVNGLVLKQKLFIKRFYNNISSFYYKKKFDKELEKLRKKFSSLFSN